jgi:hypothetical protein
MAGRTVRKVLVDLGYTVHTPAAVFGRERLAQRLDDQDWLPVAGANGWVVFCRDQHILDRPAELQAYQNARVHMFLLPGSATKAEIVDLLTGNLAEICALATARRPDVYWLRPGKVIPYDRRVSQLDRKRRARKQ